MDAEIFNMEPAQVVFLCSVDISCIVNILVHNVHMLTVITTDAKIWSDSDQKRQETSRECSE